MHIDRANENYQIPWYYGPAYATIRSSPWGKTVLPSDTAVTLGPLTIARRWCDEE